jgi:exodeoxyribonuclease VII large subunit
LKRALRMVQDARQAADELDRRSRSALIHAFRHSKERYSRATAQLNALSPLNIMARGYSMVSKKNGAIVKDEAQVSEGEKVRIRFFKGAVQADIVSRSEL